MFKKKLLKTKMGKL